MKHYIYKITNLINGKIYIGKHSTDDPNDSYMGSSHILKSAIKKYGRGQFKKKILFEYDNEEECLLTEADLVDEHFVARLDTYNVQLGGMGSWNHVNESENSQEYRKKGNMSFMEKYGSNPEFVEEHRQKTSAGVKLYYESNDSVWFGRKHKESTKEKISKSMKGRFSGDKNPSKRKDVRLKKSLKIKGRKAVNKDGIFKVIPPDLIDEYLNNGWKLGAIPRK